MTAVVGARFLAGLPARYRPDPSTIARLAPKVEQLLAGEFTEDTLRARLTAGIESEHSPAKALIRRLEGLALPKGTLPPDRPSWCGECDEHTRLRENAAGDPVRCSACHPKAVASAS